MEDTAISIALGLLVLWFLRERKLYSKTLAATRAAFDAARDGCKAEWDAERARLQAALASAESTTEILRARLTCSEEAVKLQKGRAASAHTTRGQLLEKWAPFVDAQGIDPAWEPNNWSFLGNPIDYAVFHWFSNKKKNQEEGKVVLLDVKSGKASLSTKQRRIKELIRAGKVEWREIRLD